MTHLGQIRRGMVMGFFVALLAILVAIPGGVFLQAADHRDAPLIDEDPSADINDVFVFLNPNDPTKVIFAMTVNGFAVPAVRRAYLEQINKRSPFWLGTPDALMVTPPGTPSQA